MSSGILSSSRPVAMLLFLALASGLAGAQELVTEVYDVTDLVRPVKHYPAPRLGLSDEGTELREPDDAGEAAWAIEELARLIEEVVLGDGARAAGWNVDTRPPGQLIVRAPAERLTQVGVALEGARSQTSATVYSVTARLLTVPHRVLDRVGLAREERHRVREHSAVEKGLAAVEEVRTMSAPRLATFAGQTAFVSLTNEWSYVADFTIEDEIADPVIETLQLGLVVETRVKPIGSGKRLLVQWNVTRCEAPRPFPSIQVEGPGGTTLEVELPELDLRTSQGRAVLSPEQCVVIGGLETTSDDPDRTTLLILTAEPVTLDEER